MRKPGEESGWTTALIFAVLAMVIIWGIFTLPMPV